MNQLTDRGTIFWDYGNAFLLESSRAGADIVESDGSFRYPSYVENIMGPMCFDYGFGPFRWVCTSGTDEDREFQIRSQPKYYHLAENVSPKFPHNTKTIFVGLRKKITAWLR